MGNNLFCPAFRNDHHVHIFHKLTKTQLSKEESTIHNYNYNLQMKYCFFKLLQHRDWTSVRSAIESNPILAAQRDSLGCTTLHMTCSLQPTYEIISALYQKYPDAIQMVDGQGRLPLHVAVMHGADVSILQALVSYYPESVSQVDGRGQLPLHYLLLWHTTPLNRHPNAHLSNRYAYHSPFPMDALSLLLPLDSYRATRHDSIPVVAGEQTVSRASHQEHLSCPRVMAKRDEYRYTPLMLCWESYRIGLSPWNSEEENMERQKREWNKLEAIVFASYYGNPTPNHVGDKKPSAKTEKRCNARTHNGNASDTNSRQQCHHQDHTPRISRKFFSIGSSSSVSSSASAPSSSSTSGSKTSQWKILHAAVGLGEFWCPHDLFHLLLLKFPNEVKEPNQDGNLPLMMALTPRISIEETLRDFYISFRFDPRYNASLSPSSHNNDFMDEQLNSNNSLDRIHPPTTEFEHPSKETKTTTYRPFSNVFIKSLLHRHPIAVQIPHTQTKQLPLHVALHYHRGWYEGVSDLFFAYPASIAMMDPVTKCYPFLIPVMSSIPRLNTKTTDITNSTTNTAATRKTVVYNEENEDTFSPSIEMYEIEDRSCIETMYHLLLADPSVLLLQQQ